MSVRHWPYSIKPKDEAGKLAVDAAVKEYEKASKVGHVALGLLVLLSLSVIIVSAFFMPDTPFYLGIAYGLFVFGYLAVESWVSTKNRHVLLMIEPHQ